MSHYGNGGSERKPAVSVVIKPNPPGVGAKELWYCLKERLPINPSNPNSIVDCRLQGGSEYYVELASLNLRSRLLALNGVEMTCCGAKIRPSIQPWERAQQASNQYFSEKNHNHSNSLNQHPQHSAHGIEGHYRPSKRSRAETSPSEHRNSPPLPGALRRQSNGRFGDDKAFDKFMKSNIRCKVYVKPLPKTKSLHDFCIFVNTFIRKAKICDSDVVVDAFMVKGTCILLCPSPYLAQRVVEELHHVRLDGMILNVERNRGQGGSSDASCEVWVSKLPKSCKMKPFCTHVNQQIRKTGIFDGDAVVDAYMVMGNCVLRCLSSHLAQCVVDVMDKRLLDDVTLTLRRHKSYQNASRAIDGKTDNVVPPETARRVSVSTIDDKTNKIDPSSTAREVSVPTIDGKTNKVIREVSVSTDAPPKAVPNTLNTSSEESVSDIADTSKSTAETEIANLKAENESLTKQVMKLLKENKELKNDNENLKKDVAESKEREAVGSETNKRKFDEMKQKCEAVTSELENLNVKKIKVEEELVAAKGINGELEKQLVNRKSKKAEIDDLQKRMNDIHESWQQQSRQVEEQKEEIERLKTEKAKEAAAREEVQALLTEKEQKYRDMTDALVNSASVLNEERATRKELQHTLVVFRKARKKAEKRLKAYQQSHDISEEQSGDPGAGDVKPEEHYDV